MPSIERDAVVTYLVSHLVGPLNGELEEVVGPPASRYTCGILFPTIENGLTLESSARGNIFDEYGDAVSTDSGDDPVQLSGQILPSSLGFSFYTQSNYLTCVINAATYELVGGDNWKRRPTSETVIIEKAVTTVPVLSGRAILKLKWRNLPAGGWLVTLTILNSSTFKKEPTAFNCPAECLYQVSIRCICDAGIGGYPSSEHIGQLTAEEEDLELLYRNSKPYAIGHGCATSNSSIQQDGTVSWVQSEIIPQHEVPPIVPSQGNDEVLIIKNLVKLSEVMLNDLSTFLDRYEGWISQNELFAEKLASRYQSASRRLILRQRVALGRMRRGVELICSDKMIQDSFKLANEAMLMQMFHSREFAKRREVDDAKRVMPKKSEYVSFKAEWRPFQLAFFLLCIGSEDETNEKPGPIDLIWFPTGGGKTEAYLAVAAFKIFHRRLTEPLRGGGTAVITRYTLRLLTAQQFQRTSALVCAMEVLRRRENGSLGNSIISLGLWIGKKATPNTFSEAKRIFEEIVLTAEKPQNPFQLQMCPWCGTSIIPANKRQDKDAYGVIMKNDLFKLRCPNNDCEFGGNDQTLPINVVDQALYLDPPTVLIGTVDKFARLPWDEKAGCFFGSENSDPPSLIIQDEMHLLAGPLGTIVGAYEAAIESLCKVKSKTGRLPLIIASTATIRESDSQSKHLYGRDVSVFPPSGLTAGDSFFAREDLERPGRLYVGVLGSIHSKSTSLIRTAAVLAQAPLEIELSESIRDAYWTQVIYHNSLRELGQTTTFARDDIPSWIAQIAIDQDLMRRLDDTNVLEITSNVNSSDLPAALERLNESHGGDDEVSLLVCTNMFSVGVDVQRLGLILMNSQPKSTAEYIQSTSRVGRAEDGSRPGLVVCHYATNKPRDRSHYEHFAGYHGALYKYVEPSSVSPTAIRARERVLHAALVIMARHGFGLSSNSDAAKFTRSDEGMAKGIQILIERYARSDDSEIAAISDEINRLASDWEEKTKLNLQYQTQNKVPAPTHALLKYYGQPGEGWATLNNMRNVDDECEIRIEI